MCVCSLACLGVAFSVVVTTFSFFFFFIKVEKGEYDSAVDSFCFLGFFLVVSICWNSLFLCTSWYFFFINKMSLWGKN